MLSRLSRLLLSRRWRRLVAARSITQRFRPTVEGLEERWTPAQRVWLGTLDSDPTKPGNWSGDAVPEGTDEAVFNNQATNHFQLEANDTLTVGKLTVETSFTQSFRVLIDFTLSMGQVAGNST